MLVLSDPVVRGFLKFLIVMLFLVAQGAIGYWAYEKYDLQRYVPEQVKVGRCRLTPYSPWVDHAWFQRLYT